MNEFTQEELEYLYEMLAQMVDDYSMNGKKQPDIVYGIKHKLAFMNAENKKANIIASGHILFHNKDSSSGIIPKINAQLNLCENLDEKKIFRMQWKILFGKKYGCSDE